MKGIGIRKEGGNEIKVRKGKKKRKRKKESERLRYEGNHS
jgi:hypothetical protein